MLADSSHDEIRDLTLRRDEKECLLVFLKPLLAPIRKVPAELLLEIFHIIIATARDKWLKQLLVISQVSGHWRQLACTTPQLWNRKLKINFWQKAPSVSYLATTKTFLDRSAPLPIPISFKTVPSHASPFEDLIYNLSSRWRSLYLYDSDMRRLNDLPMNALEVLESVTLILRMRFGLYIPLTTSAFLEAPRLRSVSLQIQNPGSILMPWSQLTSLHVDNTFEQPSTVWLDILAKCTNLVVAAITALSPWDQPPPGSNSMQPIELSRITSLSVAFSWQSEAGHITPFFARLSLPALTTLKITFGLLTAWSSTEFSEQFQRRAPNLVELKLIGVARLLTSRDLLFILSSDGSVRFGSRSGTFLLDAERERSVRFSELLNLEPERTFAFSSAFERVRTPDFPVII
ncbi:hypothetical protein FB45DRAFT_1068897 [Roridomyces roridus]|uniref:F-box domain-containing protein n=1 Tax=Roridomyces roridus TaxID=1738132 RepID=A0AAD7AZU5_9AGAR|nr:hypothetical protein FB45DRAFT_1068897 [Roridomyces roridus]